VLAGSKAVCINSGVLLRRSHALPKGGAFPADRQNRLRPAMEKRRSHQGKHRQDVMPSRVAHPTRQHERSPAGAGLSWSLRGACRLIIRPKNQRQATSKRGAAKLVSVMNIRRTGNAGQDIGAALSAGRGAKGPAGSQSTSLRPRHEEGRSPRAITPSKLRHKTPRSNPRVQFA
jgi:hypothetical protein